MQVSSRWIPAAGLLLSIALIAYGQTSGPESFLRIPAWPVGEAPHAQQVQVSLNGESASVLRIRGPEDELMILTVLDLTGNLAYAEEARTALAEQVRKLPGHVWVGLLRAQDGLKVLGEPGPDRETLIQKLEAIPVSGRPALLSSLEPAVRLASRIVNRAPIRVALLFITDSDIYKYREDYTNPVVNRSDSGDLSRRFRDSLIREEVARLSAPLSLSKAPVLIVHIDPQRDELNEAYLNGLLQLAVATGGTATLCRTRQEIPAALNTAFETMVSHWAIDVATPPRGGGTLALKVTADDAEFSHRPRVVVPTAGKE